MILAQNETFIETYKGYDIVFYRSYSPGYKETEFYRIKVNGERATWLALASPKACRNVIDSHFNSIKEIEILEKIEQLKQVI